jgi:hypothetical protein
MFSFWKKRMTKTAIQTIHEALDTLEFFQTAYASSDQYQERQREVVAILRGRSQHNPYSYDSKLMAGIAKAIEDASKPG